MHITNEETRLYWRYRVRHYAILFHFHSRCFHASYERYFRSFSLMMLSAARRVRASLILFDYITAAATRYVIILIF